MPHNDLHLAGHQASTDTEPRFLLNYYVSAGATSLVHQQARTHQPTKILHGVEYCTALHNSTYPPLKQDTAACDRARVEAPTYILGLGMW